MKSSKAAPLFMLMFAALAYTPATAIEPPDCPPRTGASYAEQADGVHIAFATTDQSQVSSFSASRDHQWVLLHEETRETHTLIAQQRTQRSPYLYVLQPELESEQAAWTPGRWHVEGLEEFVVHVPTEPLAQGVQEADAVLNFPQTQVPEDLHGNAHLASWASQVMVPLPESWQSHLSENVLLQGRMIVDPTEPGDPTSEGSKSLDVFTTASLDPRSGKYVAWLHGGSWTPCTGPAIPDWAGGNLLVGWLKLAADDESRALTRFEISLNDANAILDDIRTENTPPSGDAPETPTAPETPPQNTSSSGDGCSAVPSSTPATLNRTAWAVLLATLFAIRCSRLTRKQRPL